MGKSNFKYEKYISSNLIQFFLGKMFLFIIIQFIAMLLTRKYLIYIYYLAITLYLYNVVFNSDNTLLFDSLNDNEIYYVSSTQEQNNINVIPLTRYNRLRRWIH